MYQPLWEKVSAEAGCPDLWARDLRRTFATVGMSSGIKMDTISELLNHKSVQTTKLYAKLNDDARVEASSAISNKISEIVKRSST
jgi:integrase